MGLTIMNSHPNVTEKEEILLRLMRIGMRVRETRKTLLNIEMSEVNKPHRGHGNDIIRLTMMNRHLHVTETEKIPLPLMLIDVRVKENRKTRLPLLNIAMNEVNKPHRGHV